MTDVSLNAPIYVEQRTVGSWVANLPGTKLTGHGSTKADATLALLDTLGLVQHARPTLTGKITVALTGQITVQQLDGSSMSWVARLPGTKLVRYATSRIGAVGQLVDAIGLVEDVPRELDKGGN